MGHFGYEVPEGIIGEIGSTAPSIRRTFVASQRINFGEMVEMDVFKPSTSRSIALASAPSRPIVGIAEYQPTHPEGYYPEGSEVTVLTEGDIAVKIRAGENFRAGDKVYARGKSGLIPDGESDFIFTSDYHNIFPLTFYIGTFVDGGTSTADNFFRIHFNPNFASTTF